MIFRLCMPTFLLTFDITYLPLYFCVYMITFTHLHLYYIFSFSSGYLCHHYRLLGSLHLQGLYSLDVIMQSFSTPKGYHKINVIKRVLQIVGIPGPHLLPLSSNSLSFSILYSLP